MLAFAMCSLCALCCASEGGLLRLWPCFPLPRLFLDCVHGLVGRGLVYSVSIVAPTLLSTLGPVRMAVGREGIQAALTFRAML